MAELNKPVRILADTGEKGKIIKKLEAIPGVTLDFEPLDLGDYILGEGVAVERKSATDFILSIVDKSLIDSAAQLKAHCGVPRGVRTLSMRVGGFLATVSQSTEGEWFMGVDVADFLDQVRRHYRPMWATQTPDRVELAGPAPRLMLE